MKISFIGSGKMAEAIVAGLLRAKIASPAEVFASDLSAERRTAMKKDYGVNTYANNATVAGMANILFSASSLSSWMMFFRRLRLLYRASISCFPSPPERSWRPSRRHSPWRE